MEHVFKINTGLLSNTKNISSLYRLEKYSYRFEAMTSLKIFKT